MAPTEPPDATDPTMATVLSRITAVLEKIQEDGGNPAVKPPPTLVAYTANQPFNLDSRAGAAAYKDACSPLPTQWDGSIEKFPAFMLSLKARSKTVKWDAPAPHGILRFNVPTGAPPATAGAEPPFTTHNLLTDYHSITDTIIETARIARTDDRAQQNSTAMYKCLSQSITGELNTTMFDQEGNMLDHEDGPSLLSKLLSFTIASSLQLSIQSFEDLRNLDPADYSFNIPNINTKLNHLFILATTGQRSLLEPEKIQHTLTCYNRIKQPDAWSLWVQQQMDRFDKHDITNAQSFMNSAVVKYQKLSGNGSFNGKSTTVKEDIVAMLSKSTTSNKRPSNKSQGTENDPKRRRTQEQKTPLPFFAKWYKKSLSKGSPEFEHGDTKTHEGQTWHFCCYPNHKDNVRWHPFNSKYCRAWKSWKNKKNDEDNDTAKTKTNDDAQANVGDALPKDDAPLEEAPTNTPESITAALAHALQLASGNDAVYAAIADALSCVEA